MRTITHENKRRSGFTLIEVMLGSALAVTALGLMGISAHLAMNTYQEARADEELSAQLYRTLESITDELRDAGIGTLTPSPDYPDGSSSLEFRTSAGYADGALWGETRRIEWALDDGEIDDGIDNNQNGLIDEGVVLLSISPGTANEREVVMTRFVSELLEDETLNGEDDNNNVLEDEEGLAFGINGSVLSIWLTLERVGPRGQLITKTGRVAMRLMNE